MNKVNSTSAKPIKMRIAMSALALERAATGVNRVNRLDNRTPIPKTYLPPYFSARTPAGICDMM